MTALLASWQESVHTDGGVTHPTYRKGAGPGVIVIHELPGMTPEVIAFGEEVVSAGFTAVMPQLFGTPGAAPRLGAFPGVLRKVCVSSEFTKLATGVTAPLATWLRSLARELHQQLGGPGVGAVGMCFTGGFALAMMVEPAVVAPVVAQPSLPFAIGKKRAADLNLSPADLSVVRERAADGCPVLGLRYRSDKAVGTRFETMTRELGDAFVHVDLEGRGHSTLTAHRRQEAVDRVLKFFDERLH
ncbi:MAG: dienelactone hydrolase family protein [Actinomycetota bacterium]|nr:dienelactone hydrolase family protein [Actinomycetota bacterium]